MDKTFNKMHQAAQLALSNSYSPYSRFKVGACIQAEDSSLYAGCNVENASYGLTLCAEASALCDFVKAGQRKIKNVVVVASGEDFCAPCGACRQRLFEFSVPDTTIVFFNSKGEYRSATMSELFPYPFSKKTLGV